MLYSLNEAYGRNVGLGHFRCLGFKFQVPMFQALAFHVDGTGRNLHIGHVMRKYLWAYMNSEGPDQPAYPRSLIRAFAVL